MNARETVERVKQDRATVVDAGYLSAPLFFIDNRLYKGLWDEGWLGVRLRVAALSSEIRWMQMLGAGALAGVGFTMSIFIAAATFEDAQLEMVKLSILLASILSAAIGATILFTAAKT